MSRYVNIHGSNRPTVKQLTALLAVIDMGLAEAEAQLEDEDPVITPAEFSAARKMTEKLYRALLRAEQGTPA